MEYYTLRRMLTACIFQDDAVAVGSIGVEDCVRAEEIGLSNYVQESEEPLLVAVRNESTLRSEKDETAKHIKEMKMKKKQDNWKAKELHCQILRQTEDVRDEA